MILESPGQTRQRGCLNRMGGQPGSLEARRPVNECVDRGLGKHLQDYFKHALGAAIIREGILYQSDGWR